MFRSRRELSKEYLLAKIGVDTAENEHLEVWGKIQFIFHLPPYPRRGPRRWRRESPACYRGPAPGKAAAWAAGKACRSASAHGRANFRELVLDCIETKFCKQILVGIRI